MLKPFVFISILFFVQLGLSADLFCSLRKVSAGKITAMFSSDTVEKCLPECADDPQEQVRFSLEELKKNLQPLVSEDLDKMTATEVVALFKKTHKSYSNNIIETMLAERDGKISREQSISKLTSKNKQAARLELAQRAFTSYQNAVIHADWFLKFTDLGLSAKMACTIQKYQLESDVFKSIGSESTITVSEKDAILKLISHHTEAPPPNPEKEEWGLCKAFSKGDSLPNAFSNAIMQNCL